VLFTSLFTLISGFIFPATPSAVSTLAAFAILFPLIVLVLGFLLKLVRGSS
jgi:hypothetical protein